MRYFILVACLVITCGMALAQLPRYTWVHLEDNQDQWALMDNSSHRQLGVFEISRGEYSPLENDKWQAPTEPPRGAGLPPGCRLRQQLPTGVVANKIPSGDHVIYKDHEITKEQALAMMAGNKALEGVQAGDDKIPDDSNKIRISIIGSVQACAAPLAVAKKHSEFVTVDYRPDKWMIQRQGFVTPSDPTIYIQQPGPQGTDIKRLDGYVSDAAFEAVLTEITGRKIAPNPHYDQTKDEGWYKKNIAPILTGEVPWIPLSIVGGLAVYALWSRRKKISLLS